MHHNTMFIDEFKSPVGSLLITAMDSFLLSIRFCELLEEPSPNSITEKTKTFLAGYFDGEAINANIPIRWFGTPFQNNVWEVLQHVPFGKTCSYEQIAIQIRKEKNARAVGQAVGNNPLAILVPCHRVIGKNGKLTGFSGGLEAKEWLLNFEKNLSEKEKEQRKAND